MQNNNNTNSDNQPDQNPDRRQRQCKKPTAEKPDDRTDEAGYQKLPQGLRPFAGCAQRDPLDYGSHPYPSMLRFAKHLALHFDAPRTRHSYYRQLRLIHEQSGCDPSAMAEEMLRDYFLHVKTVKRWKSKTIRQAAAAAKLFFVGMLEHEEWRILRMIRTRFNTLMMTGFFRHNGQGDGEPWPTGGKKVRLESFYRSKPASTPGDPAKRTPVEAHPTSTSGFHPARRPLRLDRVQSQNA